MSIVHSIFLDNEIIEYSDYLLSKPAHEDAIDIIMPSIFNDTILTYKDAIPINESDYFMQEQPIRVDGYDSHRNDIIDTEESRQSYFIKSSRHSVRTFF